ncbi:hypothetical protein A6V39_02580 [Candidatus Mycoplasma haematobovis]|uniref:Thymidylate kinase n=1 Tax=Candidatus Mycoplasma haematobovis TaxID=432608 RepID=A0A1A9QE74_9MOLU|nr:dTMP kinase [Candidatus Mycoplasma haematobovis]OAL10301.1 hypothetical protein A6V39_02580 [Candidatus Mycoplasma haematobovis]
MEEKLGLFVVFEGVDGAGKSTLIEGLKQKIREGNYLKKSYKNVLFTREPGGKNQEFGKHIRELLLNDEYTLNDKTRALLFFAARSEHFEKLIAPALANNSLVICDRYYLSTFVYQGKGDNEKIAWIRETQKYISPIAPDVTFFINISIEEYKKRYENRKNSGNNNKLDEEHHQSYALLSKCYSASLQEGISGKIIQLNGNDPIDKLLEIVKENLDLYE